MIGVILPVKLVVEFDGRIIERPYRPRSAVIADALRHYLDCPDADWEWLEDPAS